MRSALPNCLRVRRLLRMFSTAFATTALVMVATPSGANPPSFAPYRPPTFHCPTVHYYGNGVAPPLAGLAGRTLCVVYDKRDITVDNGGAIRFALAEPARFSVAAKCQYWQRDHWRIRIDRGYGEIVQWDGSYWWDLRNGYGGA
ncbi:MAG TPA: hypothetical protein VG899_09000, partial [Mycobacteriales bacterium]|nr:hypothetical protein [Mycobacteriales bacterium]